METMRQAGRYPTLISARRMLIAVRDLQVQRIRVQMVSGRLRVDHTLPTLASRVQEANSAILVTCGTTILSWSGELINQSSLCLTWRKPTLTSQNTGVVAKVVISAWKAQRTRRHHLLQMDMNVQSGTTALQVQLLKFRVDQASLTTN